jgi:NADH-quinone oxidoreductase chain I
MTHLIPHEIVGRHVLVKPITQQYPEEKPVIPERFRGLHKLDLDLCIGCGTCARNCPNKCIEMVVAGVEEKRLGERVIRKEKKYPQVYIGRCMFCGLCQEVCPKEAIILTTRFELASYNREDMLYTYEELAKGEAK